MDLGGWVVTMNTHTHPHRLLISAFRIQDIRIIFTFRFDIFNLYTRDMQSTGFDPRGYVRMEKIFFSITQEGRVRVSFNSRAGGAGMVLHEKIKVSGGRG